MNWSSPFMIFGFLVISAVIFLLVNTLGQSVKHTDINPITMIVTQIIISVFLAFIIYFIEVQKTKNKRKNARKKIFIRLFMLIAVLDVGITKQKELIEMYGSLKKGTYLLENYFNTYMNELQDMFSFYSDVLEYEEIKPLQSHIHIILFMRKITADADIIKTYEHIKQHLMSDYDYWEKYKPKNFDNHTMDEIITSL